MWQGATLNAHLEIVGGDNINQLPSGVTWPANVYFAVPRALGESKATVSMSLTQQVSLSARLSFGKFSATELARSTPLAGGGDLGGFLYAGIAATPCLVFPPYIVGEQFAYSTDPVNYSLFIYDARNAQGSGFRGDLFSEGIVFNASVTFRATFGTLSGFYIINVVHSTEDAVDLDCLLLPPDADDFAKTTRGLTYNAFKFQQYLSVDSEIKGGGWGIFGQIGIGDGNPHHLDANYVLGSVLTAPRPSRGADKIAEGWPITTMTGPQRLSMR